MWCERRAVYDAAALGELRERQMHPDSDPDPATDQAVLSCDALGFARAYTHCPDRPLFAEMAHEQIAKDPDAQMRDPYTAHTSLALCQRIS